MNSEKTDQPEEGVTTLLQSSFVVVDCFAVVVRLHQRLTDLARQRSVLGVAFQSCLVHFNRFLGLKKYLNMNILLPR